MRSHLHLALYTHLTEIQGVGLRVGLFIQPAGGPADEVGRKEDQPLLQIDGGCGADFEMMQEKHPFAFLDARFDDLPAIVVPKPLRQVLGNVVVAEMEQEAVFGFLPVMETLQADIERIGAAGELEGRPGHHFGVGANLFPDRGQVVAAAQGSVGIGAVAVGGGMSGAGVHAMMADNTTSKIKLLGCFILIS